MPPPGTAAGWNDAGRATPRSAAARAETRSGCRGPGQLRRRTQAGPTRTTVTNLSASWLVRPRPITVTPPGSIGDVRGWLSDGWRVALVTEGHGPAQRLAELLRGENLGARAGDLDEPPEPGVAVVATGQLDWGFTWPGIRLAVLSEADLAGQRGSTRDRSRMPSRRRGGIDPLQLTPGDYVVHSQHGVGRYLEMTSRTIQGSTREYLVIEYAPSKRGQPPDRLYLPTDQLDEVTRYSGGEAPSLHRLGGADWAKTKGRARKAVREIAAQLIRLYSARVASPGHAFGQDSPWQRELEDAFPYAETPDQLAAIDEIKRDMEKPLPMDRLICGDVGYGKTELAVRAAFKAVQDGKQVAVLVPTTLLVQQHMQTFGERYGPFPVELRALSRFQSERRGDADAGRARRRDRRRGDRHAPAALAGDQVQEPRADHHRRGAAVRRRAQGVPEGDAHPGRRALDVGDADPADPGDGRRGDQGDVHDPDPAGGAAPGADLRRALRREADRGGDPPGAAPRRPDVLRAQPGRLDRQGRGPAGRARARGAGSRSRTAR